MAGSGSASELAGAGSTGAATGPGSTGAAFATALALTGAEAASDDRYTEGWQATGPADPLRKIRFRMRTQRSQPSSQSWLHLPDRCS
eukprot:654956-Prymnesium_polylepis.1